MAGSPTTLVTAVVIADRDRFEADRIGAVIGADPDLVLVGVASRPADAVDLLCDLEPAVAVIDVNLLSFCDHPLHGWGPISREIRLVAVGPGDDPYVRARMRAGGFAAYVPLERLDDELCDAVRGGPAGRTTASRSLTR